MTTDQIRQLQYLIELYDKHLTDVNNELINIRVQIQLFPFNIIVNHKDDYEMIKQLQQKLKGVEATIYNFTHDLSNLKIENL